MRAIRSGQILAAAAIALCAFFLRLYVAGALAAAAAPQGGAPAVPHFDHTPRHGGLVLMNGDTHFEVVLNARGEYQVYFTDAVRAPLPASIASRVWISLTDVQDRTPAVELQIDPSGAYWMGRGVPITNANAVVRVTYAAASPYWIDVPVSAWPAVSAALPK